MRPTTKFGAFGSAQTPRILLGLLAASAALLACAAMPATAFAAEDDPASQQADVPELQASEGDATLEGDPEPQEAEFVDADGDKVIIGEEYRIVSAADEGLLLDGAGETPKSGANVSVWESNGGENQLFTFSEAKDGSYTLKSAAANLVLDAENDVPFKGSNVTLWKSNGGKNQMWVIKPAGTDANGVQLYIIQSLANSNLVLDAAGEKPVSGANVSVWKANGGDNQKWYFVKASSLAYATIVAEELLHNETGSAVKASVSVNLNGESLQEGVDYQVLYDGAASVSEAGSYKISVKGISDKCTGLVETGYTMQIAAKPAIDEGAYYKMYSQANDKLIVDAENGLPVSGSNASVWTDNGGSNQAVYFEFDAARGYYTIRSVAVSSLVLDAANSNPASGANVTFWKDNGGLNQRWIVVEVSKGVYRIVCAANPSLVLDAQWQKPVSGSNVSVWGDNGGKNQLWGLVKQELKDISTMEVFYGDVAYTGKKVLPDWIQFNGVTLRNGADYTVSCTNNLYVGQAQVSITGRGLYTGTTSTTFWIYLPNGVYYVKDAETKSVVLDVSGASTEFGANVLLWKLNEGKNQGFSTKYLGKGEYSIENYNSKMSLDVLDSKLQAGTKIIQWSYSGTDNQKWILSQDSTGFTIKSALGDWYLGTSAGTATSGSQLGIYDAGNAVKFAFSTVPSKTIKEWDRPPMTALQRDMFNRAQAYSSPTNWLIMADCQNCYLGIFYWDGDGWEYMYYWRSSPGAWATPTPTGVYYVGSRGYSFGSGFTCYYWTQFYGDYLIHSPVYYQGTFDLMEGVMGEHASHGCIRVLIDNAKWVYDNIPSNTKVVVYY